MTTETKAPKNLLRSQMWFGSIVRMPIDSNSRMASISPTGCSMEEEAAEFISPSPTLRPAERIQIYCQQYWWRLLSTLQENYPFLTRIFGYYEFNQKIAVPYLLQYPPDHWSLNCLGDRLPEWIEKSYNEEDKQLIGDVACIDWAYNDAFVAPQKEPPPLHLEPSAIFASTLYLQPYVHLFQLDSDLFAMRQEFLKEEPDYWLEHDFPKSQESRYTCYLLYRSKSNSILYAGISEAEFSLLDMFYDGASIDLICRRIENAEEEYYQEAAANLKLWIQNWLSEGLLTQQRRH